MPNVTETEKMVTEAWLKCARTTAWFAEVSLMAHLFRSVFFTSHDQCGYSMMVARQHLVVRLQYPFMILNQLEASSNGLYALETLDSASNYYLEHMQ